MADVRSFPRVGPRPPATLTPDERAQWDEMVGHLRAVGVLARTRSATLTRFVRRSVRLRALSVETRAVDGLTRKLQRLARRLEGADARTVTAAAARLTDLWFLQMDEQRRGGLLDLKFLNAHRLTPRSRFEG